MLLGFDIVSFVFGLFDRTDVGIAVLPNIVIWALGLALIGVLLRKTWLSLTGVLLTTTYYVLASFTALI